MRLIALAGFNKAMSCGCRDKNETERLARVYIKSMKVVTILSAALFASVVRAELQNPQTYWEMCDASAAVALDKDHFIAADDEGNTLRVYKRGEPLPVKRADLTPFLVGGKKKKAPEADLEGAARVGDRIYWIGSHGRNKDAKPAPSRQRFFATQIATTDPRDVRPIGRPYDGLLEDLLADTRFKQFGLEPGSLLAPKSEGGLNIEGLCARPDGTLLIAFRNPVPHGKGLIVPLLNPARLIEGGARAQFGEMIQLDLGGFGVRDLTLVGDTYYIIAGARDTSHKFHLYEWDGKTSTPKLFPGKTFEKLNPEAIFRFPNDPAGVFQILSDDGGRKTGGKECKEYPQDQRHFRAGELHLSGS
jgi:hypothetical protein